MTKVKKLALFFILVLLTATICLSFSEIISKAETVREDSEMSNSENGSSSTYGIYTNITFSIDGGNGSVWAAAKNKFTLFPSVVEVNLYLYKADTYQENYADMKLVAISYTGDLDQGETLTAEAFTNGKESYWKARILYKVDSKDWVEKITEAVLFDANGIRVF